MALLYWIAGYQYEAKPDVLELLRNFFMVAGPAMLVIYFTDVIRQLHFGMNCYVGACVCEILSFFYTIFWAWYLGIYLQYDFWGILGAFAISQFSGYLGYFVSFLFNKAFYDIPIFFNTKKALKKQNSKKGSDLNISKLSQSNWQEDLEKLGKFDNLKYYLCFELEFSVMMLLESSWIRLDTIIASMVLDTSWLAALTAFFNFISMMDCFSYGFGFATTSMMTKYLVNGQVRRAKVTALWSMIIVLVLAVIMSSVMACYTLEMANVFLKTEGKQDINTDARDKLQKLFEIFPFILPAELVLGEMVAYVRAIGQAKIFIITQILGLYLVHFFVMWMLLSNTDLQGVGIAINLGITYGVMAIVTTVVCSLTDWRKVSATLRKDFLDKSAMPQDSSPPKALDETVIIEMCETRDPDTVDK